MKAVNYTIILIPDFQIEKFLGSVYIAKSSIEDIFDSFDKLEPKNKTISFESFIRDKDFEKKISLELGYNIISKNEEFFPKPTDWIYLVREIEGKIEYFYIVYNAF